MKRELKFRVWNGAEMVHDVTVGKFGTFYVNPTNNGLDPNDSASLTPFTTKYPEGTPVMQYTGLKDKNGKEIYEGDVINVPYNHIGKQRVEWESHRGRWSVAVYDLTQCSVIGNIYSNPELLNP